MTTPFPELTDPREAFLSTGYQPVPPPPPKDSPHLLLIGMGIGAAILGIKMVMSHRLAKENPASPEEAKGLAQSIWDANKYVWRKLATPSVVDAYKYGAPALFIPPDALEKLAIIYVDELGDYFNQTSIDALTEGFSAQLNSGWSNDIAWRRSVPAYGLDSKQTRSYVITLTDQAKGKYDPQPIPEKSAAAIDRLMLDRADRIGSNEAHKATQMGRNVVWQYMEKHGDIHGAKKRWLTAQDELVCSVCASLNRQEQNLADPFETPTGEKIHAPGAHPNCRCEIVLNMGMDIVKNMPGDPYDRDHHGRFAFREERKTPRLEITRPPIGSRYVPIGEYGSPIGETSGPLGWARSPIGQTLPPIAAAVEPIADRPEIGAPKPFFYKTKPEPPKIAQNPPTITSKNPIASNVKATTKTKNKTKIPNKSSISSPLSNPVSIGNKADIEVDSPTEIHDRKAVIPGSSVMLPDEYGPKLLSGGIKGKYVYFDGNRFGFAAHEGKTIEASNAYRAAFQMEMEAAEVAYQPVPDLPFDTTRSAFLSNKEGSSRQGTKPTAVMFMINKPWAGSLNEVTYTDEPPMAIPEGFYRITAEPHSDNVAAARRQGRSAFPPSVQEDINDEIANTVFRRVSDADKAFEQVAYIPIERVAFTPPKDEVIKWAPRLFLRRK